MIEINYTLRTNSGDFLYETRHAEHVPRTGDTITFDGDRSFDVVDVLWHLQAASPTGNHVTITAVERNWHQYIEDVVRRGSAAELDDEQSDR